MKNRKCLSAIIVFTAAIVIAGCSASGAGGGGSAEPSPDAPSTLGYRPTIWTRTDGTETNRWHYSYNSTGELVEAIYDDNQQAPGVVVDRYKYEITYTAEGRLLEVTAYSNANDDVPAAWTANETQTFSYDSEGNLQEYLFDNDPNDGHDGDFKMVVLGTGSTISEVRRWDYDDTSGQLELTGFLDIDTLNGLVTGYDYYSNTGTSSSPAWTSDNRRDRFSYDGSGRLIAEQTEKFAGGVWMRTWEQTYTYFDSGWLSTDTDTDYYDDGSFDYSTQINYLLDPSTGLPVSYTRERDNDGTGYVSDGYSYTIAWETHPMNDSFRQLDFAHSLFDIPDGSIWVRRIAEPIDK